MNLFEPADILIPKTAEMEKWSVIACDQFTSQPEYWERVEEYVGDAPSSLKLIFPEAKLGEESASMVSKIREAMEQYLKDGIFKTNLSCIPAYVQTKRHRQKIDYTVCKEGILIKGVLYSVYDCVTNTLQENTSSY